MLPVLLLIKNFHSMQYNHTGTKINLKRYSCKYNKGTAYLVRKKNITRLVLNKFCFQMKKKLWETKLIHLAIKFHAEIFICAVGMHTFNDSSPSMLFSCHGSPLLLLCEDSKWKYCKCRSYFSHLKYDELCFDIVSRHTSPWRKYWKTMHI